MKKISVLILIMILMLGVSGCMTSNITKNPTIDLVSYMNNKYDDEFSYKAPFGGGAGATTKQMIVSSKKYPEYDIWVEYSEETGEYRDNYVDYKLKEQCEKYFETELGQAFSAPVSVNRDISTSGSSADYADDTDINEYLNTDEQKIMLIVAVAYSEDSYKEDAEKILSTIFGDVDAQIYSKVYFVDSANACETFPTKTLAEKNEYPYVFADKNEMNIVRFDWR